MPNNSNQTNLITPNLSTGYLAFLIPKTCKDKLIALLDGGKYSHVELMVKPCKDGRYLTISSLPKTGVRMRKVALDDPDRWIKIPVKVDAEYCLNWYEQHKNNDYDYKGLITSKFSWFSDDKHKYYCSEAIANMLKLQKPDEWSVKEIYEHFK